MQFICDIGEVSLERPQNVETTALGAACLAGLQAGIWDNQDALADLPGKYTRFDPNMADATRNDLLKQWDIAVKTTRYRAQLQQG